MKKLLKEILIIVIYVGVSFLIKGAAINIYKTSHRLPIVEEEKQELFNKEVAYQSYGKTEFSFGLKGLEYLGYPDYEFDNQIMSMSQLENINETRNQILETHAQEYGNKVLIWSLVILIGLRYLRKIYRWYKQSK